MLSNGLHEQDVDEFEGRTVYLEESIDLTGHAWTPIATYIWNGVYEDNHYFKGIFDGKQHLINNMILLKDFDISYIGLFGNIISGEIRNVSLIIADLIFIMRQQDMADVDCSLICWMKVLKQTIVMFIAWISELMSVVCLLRFYQVHR